MCWRNLESRSASKGSKNGIIKSYGVTLSEGSDGSRAEVRHGIDQQPRIFIFNCPNGKIHGQIVILRVLFDISGFPLLRDNNVTVFTHSLLNKGTICNELLILHDTLFTNMKFLNKFRNFLIFMSCLEMEYRIRRIIKYVSYITEVLGIKSYVTIKALSIYQDLST